MATTMSPELAALCAQLKQWRQQGGGGRGKRVPAALWRQAATVAQSDGIWKTAQTTRLNYERLRAQMATVEVAVGGEAPGRSAARRARTPAPRAHEPESNSAQFVAVPMTPRAPAPSLTIELVQPSGERMRIESAGAFDVAGIVQAFWRRS